VGPLSFDEGLPPNLGAFQEAPGLLSAMTHELKQARIRKGDVSLHSVLRTTHLLNEMLERVKLRVAVWNNNRNAGKVEKAASEWGAKSVAEMLALEHQAGIHKSGGRIMDDSAACGLLWLRRSIHFFVELVDASVENDKRPPASLVKPAQEAYSRSLASFHTFTTRAFFRTLLSMLPNSEAYMPALMTPMYQSGMVRMLAMARKECQRGLSSLIPTPPPPELPYADPSFERRWIRVVPRDLGVARNRPGGAGFCQSREEDAEGLEGPSLGVRHGGHEEILSPVWGARRAGLRL